MILVKANYSDQIEIPKVPDRQYVIVAVLFVFTFVFLRGCITYFLKVQDITFYYHANFQKVSKLNRF